MSEADFQFEFKEPANLPNPMLSMQHVDFGYPAAQDALTALPPPSLFATSANRSGGQRIVFWVPTDKVNLRW
jgi:ATP-binding cassette subfamily F protein 3